MTTATNPLRESATRSAGMTKTREIALDIKMEIHHCENGIFSLFFLFTSQPPSKCHRFTQEWDISKGAEVNIISNALDQDAVSVVDWVETGNVVEQRYLEKRSPILCKRSPSPCIKKKIKKGKKVDLGYGSVRWGLPIKFAGKTIAKKKKFGKKVLSGTLITKSAPLGKKLIGLTFASPPLALILKKKAAKVTAPIIGIAGTVPKLAKAGSKKVGPLPKLAKAGSKKVGPVVPKLAKTGPKAVTLAAFGPLALGPKVAPVGAKLLKAGPLLAPGILKKGAGPLLPVGKKAAIGLPAVLLLHQSHGSGNQGSGSSRSGNGGIHNRRSEEATTTRAPTEEEDEAALEGQAAMQEAEAAINEAKATMQQVLAAMRGTQLPTGMKEALAALGMA